MLVQTFANVATVVLAHFVIDGSDHITNSLFVSILMRNFMIVISCL